MTRRHAVIDRIAYSPYGEATRTLRSDVNGDGFVNQSDYTGVIRPRNGAAIGTATYIVEADLDRNGVINQLDYDICIADDGKSSSGGVGEAGLFSRGVRNSIGYCGYVFNEDSGLYTVRFRTYSPTLGRWLERDPAGYVDGMGLYEYVRGGAISAVDPWGLQAGLVDAEAAESVSVGTRLFFTCSRLDASALAAWGALASSDNSDVSAFVKTQSCILQAIHKCVDCEADEEWLGDVVHDFMTPFTRSLEERGAGRPVTDPGWREFFRRLDAREIPAEHWRLAGRLADNTSPSHNIVIHCLSAMSYVFAGTPGAIEEFNREDARLYRFVDQMEIARQMALNHIRSDLDRALQRNGIGDDKVWRCVGDTVERCQRSLLEGHRVLEFAGNMAGKMSQHFDVQKLRDAMRERVRRERRERLEELILRGAQCGPRSLCRQA